MPSRTSKRFFTVTLLSVVLSCLLLLGLSPVETPRASSARANPAATGLSGATQASTGAGIPGIETPLTINGVSFQLSSASRADSYTASLTGDKITPKASEDNLLVVTAHLITAPAPDTVKNIGIPSLGDDAARVYSAAFYDLNVKDKALTWVYSVPRTVSAFQLTLSDGTRLDLAPLMSATAVPADDQGAAQTPDLATSAAIGDSLENLVVRSYPTGCNVYAAPKGAPIYEIMAGKNLIGTTPLDVQLAPGDYTITVAKSDTMAKVDVYPDGEKSILSMQAADGASYEQFAKVYSLTKQAGHKAILVSLFWPKSQSVGDFVKALPDEPSLVKILPARSVLEGLFRDHNVPPEAWDNLVLMFQKTGKVVWHGAKDSDYLYVYFAELEPQATFAVDPAK